MLGFEGIHGSKTEVRSRMKSKHDEMMNPSVAKKKVRRRIKKSAQTKIDKKVEKKAKIEAAAQNRVYLSSGASRHLSGEDKQPSRFRAQSADWKAGMEENVPKTEQNRDRERKGFSERIKSFTPMQWASGFMAIVILITSMTSTVVYANYQGEQKVSKAYEVLASYEETAPLVTAMATEIEEEEIPLAMDEPEVITGKVVSLVLSSVEKDLKIKVVDEEDNLLKGIRWKATVTDEEDKSTELVDDDMDGIIHAEDMAAGNYSVVLASDAPADEYVLPSAPMTVAVKAKIEYKVIQDIKDLIKKESEINVAAEDTGGQQAADVEGAALKDTVEYVESTKSASGKVPGYVPVDKNTADLSKITAAMSPSWIDQMRATVMGTLKAASGSGAFGNHIVGMPAALLTVSEGGTIAVSSVNVSGGGTIEVGRTIQLSADVQPADHTGGSVTWKSENEAIATVNESGQVTGISAGSATITATVGGKSGSATVTVSAPAKTISKVDISSTSTSLEVGKTTQLTANTTYSDGSTDGSVTWASSDTSIATVNNGLVTAVKAGKVTISATSSGDSSKSAACTVTVSEATPFTISQTSASVAVGATTRLTTSLSATFASSDTSVATVAADGTVKGVKAGTATITATSADKKTATCTVTVTAVTPFTISPTTASVEVGATTILKTSLSATFASSDSSVATVAADGTVKGVKAGTATITATGADGKTATCTVTVTNTGIVLSGTAEIAIGQTSQLTATVSPTTATIKWSSSDTSVATVSDKGLVTGIKAGTTTITAEASTGKKATMKITVKALDDKTELFDKNGNKLYVRTGSEPNYEYRRATYADYKDSKITKFYIYGEVDEYRYTGWQTIEGKTYYFKKDNTKVTGEQVIGGVKYNFASDGSLTQGSGTLGIDVSKYQPNINWASVKASGISYVIIRCGYRGSSTGVLVEDPYFRSHIKGAKAAGLKVGVYFFTTAVTEAEAVEEASMCASLCSGYGINYPVFMDCESSGRAGYMSLSPAQRTSIIKAFCNTVKSAGYTPGVYANKTWLTSYINTSELSAYKIWLAQYNSTVTYKGRYDLWQFTSKGAVNGISGNVDMNQSYLGY